MYAFISRIYCNSCAFHLVFLVITKLNVIGAKSLRKLLRSRVTKFEIYERLVIERYFLIFFYFLVPGVCVCVCVCVCSVARFSISESYHIAWKRGRIAFASVE